jgi:uncharacterized membrane protein
MLDKDANMQRRITVNRSLEEVYAFWRDFQHFPRLMTYVTSVEDVGPNQTHWKASLSTALNFEWDTELVEDRPNEVIAWRSVDGASMQNSGSVHFKPAPGEYGVEVTLNLDVNPPGGVLGDAVAMLAGAGPESLTSKALYRFKTLIEAGEIPTATPQPAARHGGQDQ